MSRRLFLAAACRMPLAACAALSAFIVPHSAFAATPATAPTSQSAPDPARLPVLIQRLGNPDFAQREAAQKELDQATWRDLDLLQNAADAATDPEIKARLTARIAAISEGLALNPPPISVELKDAIFPQVADALCKALHVKLDSPAFPADLPGPPLPTFTLSAKDQPFWEVFFALSRQHTLSIEESGTQLRLVPDGHDWHNPVLSGPLAVVPMSITRRVSLQNLTPGQPPPIGMELICAIALDPRIRVLKYDWPSFSEITDDLGNNLTPPFPKGIPTQNNWGLRANLRSQVFALPITPKRGTRIVSAKGTMHYVVQTAEEHLDIADPEKKVGQTFEVAGSSVKLTLVDIKPASIHVTMQTTRLTPIPDPPPARPGFIGPGGSTPYVVVTIIDATAKEFPLRGDGTSDTPFTPPIKLRLSVTTKTKDLLIPFELKDLPLP